MKKILIPVDFSEYTWSTIDFAIRMSENMRSEIRLIHSFDDPFVDKDISATPFQNEISSQTEALIHKMEKDAKDAMEALLIKVKAALQNREKDSIIISSKVVRGFVSDEILREAKLWHPHILLMGSRGHARVEKLVFGTITQSIVKNANAPVLALPADYTFTPMKQILYATNFHDYDVYAIGKLINLFQDTTYKLHITHFNIDEDIENDEEKMLQLHQKVEQDHRSANISFEILNEESLNTAFSEYVSNNKIDLIAITARRMSKWQSIFTKRRSAQLLNQINIPLLVFHEA